MKWASVDPKLRAGLVSAETDRSETDYGTGQGPSSLKNAAAETARGLALASMIRQGGGLAPAGTGGIAGTIKASGVVNAAAGGSVKSRVQQVASRYGWGSGAEWEALDRIVEHESSWRPDAQNPTSTAFGLFQFLNSTWAGTGVAKSSDPVQQAEAGMRYIKNRYGSPSAAWAFWQKNRWY